MNNNSEQKMTDKTELSGTQPEILIVEDSAVEAEILRRILVRAGYRVTLTKNGEEGLHAARACRPALVVSDIRMPVMNGYELCHEIKYDKTLWNVPVILLTVLSEPEDIMQAINGGADSYIIKPFVDASLLERVRALLATPIRRKRAEEQRSEKVEYNSKLHTITGGSQQILNLLLSVYENTLVQNRDLTRIQTQLNLLNESLDEQVRQRTANLLLEQKKLERVNRTLRIMSACHIALAHASTEEEMFHNVCPHIVEIGGHLFAGISFLGEGSESVSYPALYFGSIAISQRLAELQRDTEYVRHSVALATQFSRQTKVYQGGHNDAEYSLEKLAGLGIKSGLALPLVNNDRFYGVLTVFSSTSEAFDAVEVKLMEELAGDIAYGIVTLRARC
jgi:DNA-binding response OmpR family regulator